MATYLIFLRNTDLDARNYYAPTRGVYIQNQFWRNDRGPDPQEQDLLVRRLSGNEADYRGDPELSRSFGSRPRGHAHGSGIAAGNLRSGKRRYGSEWNVLGGASFEASLVYPVAAGEPYYTAGCANTATCVFPQRHHSPERHLSSGAEHDEIYSATEYNRERIALLLPLRRSTKRCRTIKAESESTRTRATGHFFAYYSYR